jgi:two-component system NarL family sensor kinase
MKSKPVFFLLLLFLFSNATLWANKGKTDSLIAKLTSVRDSEKVDILIRLIEDLSDYNAVKAKEYAFEALNLAEKINYVKGIAQSNLRYGLELWYEGNAEESIIYIEKAYAFYIRAGAKKGAGTALSCLGSVFKDKGNYDKAVNYQFKALKIKEELNDTNGVADCYICIGNIYRVQKEYKKAEEYYKKSLAAYNSINKKRGVANSYLGLGNVYYSQHINDTALDYYLASLKITEEKLPNGSNIGDKNAISTALNNVGLAYSELGKYDKAMKYYSRSLKIKEEQGDKMGIAYCYIGTGLTYYKMGNYAKAREHQEKCLALYRQVKANEGIKNAYQALAKTYFKLNDPKTAYQYFNLYSDLKDSLFDIESKIGMAKMEGLYKTEKKDKEILTLEKENRIKLLEINQERMMRYAVIALAAFLILIISLIFNQLRLNHRKKILEEKQVLLNKVNQHQKELLNTALNAQEEERKRIAAELHDGLGGMLSTVKLNLDTFTNKIKLAEQREDLQQSVTMLDEVCSDLRTISHNMMPGVLLKLGLISATKDFTSKINSAGILKIQFESHGIKERLEENIEIALFRVIQEATNNMLKHANASRASIQFIGYEDSFTVMIEDNGKGFDVEQIKLKQGIGLKSIESRIAYLGGKVVVDSHPDKGTSLIIELPYKNNAA